MTRSVKEKLKSIVPPFIIGGFHQVRVLLLRLYYFIFHITHPGKRFSCNYCGSSHSRFLADGAGFEVIERLEVRNAGIRENCLCPKCLSKDRERTIKLFIERKLWLNKRSKVLHMAPEKNLSRWIFSEAGDGYFDGDLNPKHASMVIDVTKIQFEDNYFDAVLCNHVLEHIPDDRLAMSELFRVLKPNGWAILQVPIGMALKSTYEDDSVQTEADREIHFGQFDHVRIYGMDYVERLKSVGFSVDVVPPSAYLSEEEIKQFALLEDEEIFLCKKSA